MKNVLLILSFLFIIAITLYLLFLGNFFCDFDPAKFNDIVTPIIALTAAIIYYLTLKEIIRTNKISKNIGYYNMLDYRIVELEISLREKQFFHSPGLQDDELSRIYSKSNAKNFIELYSKLYSRIDEFLYKKEDNFYFDVLKPKNNPPEIKNSVDFFIHLKLDLIIALEPVYELITNVISLKLDPIQQKTLITKIKDKLLKDYLSLFVMAYFLAERKVTYKGKEFIYRRDEIR